MMMVARAAPRKKMTNSGSLIFTFLVLSLLVFIPPSLTMNFTRIPLEKSDSLLYPSFVNAPGSGTAVASDKPGDSTLAALKLSTTTTTTTTSSRMLGCFETLLSKTLCVTATAGSVSFVPFDGGSQLSSADAFTFDVADAVDMAVLDVRHESAIAYVAVASNATLQHIFAVGDGIFLHDTLSVGGSSGATAVAAIKLLGDEREGKPVFCFGVWRKCANGGDCGISSTTRAEVVMFEFFADGVTTSFQPVVDAGIIATSGVTALRFFYANVGEYGFLETFLVVANSLLLEQEFGLTRKAEHKLDSSVYMWDRLARKWMPVGGTFATDSVSDVRIFTPPVADPSTANPGSSSSSDSEEPEIVMIVANARTLDSYVWRPLQAGQQMGQFYKKGQVATFTQDARPQRLAIFERGEHAYVAVSTSSGIRLFRYIPGLVELVDTSTVVSASSTTTFDAFQSGKDTLLIATTADDPSTSLYQVALVGPSTDYVSPNRPIHSANTEVAVFIASDTEAEPDETFDYAIYAGVTTEGPVQATGSFRIPGSANNMISVSPSARVALEEGTATRPGTEVFTFTSPVGHTYFEIVAGNDNEIFRVENDKLLTRLYLDREMLPLGSGHQHRLLIRSLDLLNPSDMSQSGLVWVVIDVTDINDSPPFFVGGTLMSGSAYEASVPEHAAPGTVVITVSAADNDVPDNIPDYSSLFSGGVGTPPPVAEHTFQLFSTTPQTYNGVVPFSIDPETGVIITNVAFDRENLDAIFSVNIRVVETREDGSVAFDQTTLLVDVKDINDNGPVFAASIVTSVEISETSDNEALAAGSVPGIGVVSGIVATDLDAGSNALISYALADDFEGRFKLHDVGDGTHRVVTGSRAIDYDAGDAHFDLVVRACDAGTDPKQLCSELTISVKVLNINDNAPLFPDSTVYVPPLGSEAIRLDDGSYAVLETTDGTTTVITRLDATDRDATQPGAGAVSDGFGTVRYGIEGPAALCYKSYVCVDPSSGAVSVAAGSPPESPLTIDIEAYDNPTTGASQHSSPTRHVVTVHVLKRPSFARPSGYFFSFSEHTPPGTQVGTEAISASVNQKPETDMSTVLYRIVDGNDDEIFSIGPTSGILAVSAGNTVHLDYENDAVPKSTTLTIEAVGQGMQTLDRSSTILVSVTMEDINDKAPVFTHESYSTTIREDDGLTSAVPSQNTANVVVVAATDQDTAASNRLLRYSIASAVGTQRSSDATESTRSQWTIDAQTGSISATGRVDADTYERHELVVLASDNVHVVATTVIINIEDINDIATEFLNMLPGAQDGVSRYVSFVNEDAPVGTLVDVVSIRDGDSEDVTSISLRLIAHPDAAANNEGGPDAFQVASNGAITIKAALNHEEYRRHRFLVEANDGRFIVTAEVLVTVGNYNEHVPEFTASSITTGSVVEEASTPQVVGTVQAFDSDSDDTVSYVLAAEARLNFRIDAVTGILTGTGPFDRETKNQYQVVVFALDTGGLAAQTIVTVDVTDVNDNPPVIVRTPTNVVVNELTAIGSAVGSQGFQATDRDLGENAEISWSLEGSEQVPLFSIGATDGIVRLDKRLDYETATRHVVTVVATDQGAVSNTAKFELTVAVSDGNDNPPIITNSVRDFTLPEAETGPGVVVFQANAADADGTLPHSAVSYIIVSQGSPEIFQIDQNTGAVILNAKLDYEERGPSAYTVQVAAVNTASDTTLSSPATTFTLTLSDSNDNAPVCVGAPFSASVAEHSQSEAFGTIKASDVDFVDAAPGLKYAIVKNDASTGGGSTEDVNFVNHFAVSNTGVVSTTADSNIDRELFSGPASIALDIKVTDNAGHSVICRMNVEVVDINDNAPHFEQPAGYLFSAIELPDGNLDSKPIGKVHAADADAAGTPFGTVQSYVITDGNSDNYLTIDSATGEISVARSIDAEQVSQIDITVTAYDAAPNFPMHTEVSVRVTVVDANDNIPVFSRSTYLGVDPPEDALAGTVIATVSATDADRDAANNQVAYRIISDPTDAMIIGATSGIITMTKPLDADVDFPGEIAIVVEAFEPAAPERKTVAEVRFRLVDINDNSPGFYRGAALITADTAIIIETAGIGLPLYTPVVRDADRGRNARLTFSLKSAADAAFDPAAVAAAASDFAIDPATGVVTVANRLDRETRDLYSLLVTVTDNADPASGHPPLSATMQLAIIVSDANDRSPVFDVENPVVEVPENSPPGTYLLTNSATDVDETSAGRLAYAVSSIRGVASSGEQTLLASSFFSVEPTTGAVRTNNGLDAEQFVEVQMLMRVSDDRFTVVNLVTVKIINTNDNTPVIDVGDVSDWNVDEEQSDAIVGVVTASDADAGDEQLLTFALAPTLVNAQFTIDAKTGVVKTAVPLDYEEAREHEIEVRVTDRTPGTELGNTATLVVVVKVNELNDNAPQFDRPVYVFEATEGATGDLGSVLATDNDSPETPFGRISYQIETSPGGSNGFEASQFAIDSVSGRVSVVQLLDHEEHTSFEFLVRASDGGEPAKTAVVTVRGTLRDINDNAPKFAESSYQVNIEENQPAGTFVVVASANDADKSSQGSLRYSLSGVGAQDFSIDASLGVVSLRVTLDYERTSSYQLVVTVTDQNINGITDDAQVSLVVNVVDINDLSPRFTSTSFSATVAEGTPANSPVLVLRASDGDGTRPHRTLTYSLAQGAPAHFRLQDNTGTLYTTEDPLDREEQDKFVFGVTVSDGTFSDTSTVTIDVSDVADNAPLMDETSYAVAVPEQTDIRTIVMTFGATDADIGLAGTVVGFRLESADADLDAGVSENELDFKVSLLPGGRGQMEVSRALDHETRSVYHFNLIAIDGAGDDSAPALVTVTVVNENDHAPVCSSTSLSVDIIESADAGATVAQLECNDIDAGEFGRLSYSMVTGSSQAFILDGDSGHITTSGTGVLDRETIPGYVLILSVTDGLNFVTVTVTVTVTDANDNCPVFDVPLTPTKYVNENYVGQVFVAGATDADIGPNGQVRYLMEGGGGDLVLDRDTGAVSTGPNGLDYERTDSYELRITAWDGGATPCATVVRITVLVIDGNDNAPVFVTESLLQAVEENKPVGTLIGLVRATDADTTAGGAVLDYAIADDVTKCGLSADTPVAPVQISTADGALRTEVEFDREQKAESYSICVRARDNGLEPQMETYAVVVIAVVDTNDNEPVMPYPVRQLQYSWAVKANAAVRTIVGTVDVTDADVTSVLTYTIEAGNEDRVFDIVPGTGELHTARPVPSRSHQSAYELTVQASDGEFSASGTVRIHVEEVDPTLRTHMILMEQQLMRLSVQAGVAYESVLPPTTAAPSTLTPASTTTTTVTQQATTTTTPTTTTTTTPAVLPPVIEPTSGMVVPRVFTKGGPAPTGSSCNFPYTFEGAERYTCVRETALEPGAAEGGPYFCGTEDSLSPSNPASFGYCNVIVYSVSSSGNLLRNGIREGEYYINVNVDDAVVFEGSVVTAPSSAGLLVENGGKKQLWLDTHVATPAGTAAVVISIDAVVLPVSVLVKPIASSTTTSTPKSATTTTTTDTAAAVTTTTTTTDVDAGTLVRTMEDKEGTGKQGPGHSSTCRFPFSYRGVEYTSCTCITAGAHSGIPWCATGNYLVESDGMWAYCDASTIPDDGSVKSCPKGFGGSNAAPAGGMFASLLSNNGVGAAAGAAGSGAAGSGLTVTATVVISLVVVAFVLVGVALFARRNRRQRYRIGQAEVEQPPLPTVAFAESSA